MKIGIMSPEFQFKTFGMQRSDGMTKEESKRRILAEWERWKDDPSRATYQEMQQFYFWLEEKHPELLQWRIRPGIDRWQDVHGWLNVRTNYGSSGP